MDYQPQLLAYRLSARSGLDEELVWGYVQRVGGHISIRSDCIDFWVPESAELFLVLAWPELERHRELDYI